MMKWLTATPLLFSVYACGQTVLPILQPHTTFVNSSGGPCSGCQLFSYVAGTTTPLPTFTSSTGLVSNTNPVILDATGGAQIWVSAASYKFQLQDASGNPIWTVDNVPGSISSGGGGTGTVTLFSAPAGLWPTWFVPTVINPTSTPQMSITLSSQTQNQVLASPNGSSGPLAVRALVAADLPSALTPTSVKTTTYYNAAEFSNGTCTTAKTIDPVNGNRQKVTLTNGDTCALTFTQPASGTASISLKIIQSTVAGFDGGISGGNWPGGVVPTITQTTGAVDFISCYLDGTNTYCVASQDFR